MTLEQTSGTRYRKGRGSLSNRESRYLHRQSSLLESALATEPGRVPTELLVDHAKSIIATNRSADIPFTQSINPYKGCEHGCVYCYARPTHAYWDLSPGLDFETKIFYKPNGPALLEQELARPGYRCSPIAFGTNTDPYQPVDRQLGFTRQFLEILQRHRHPFTIVTKGSHIERDLDLLQDMASHRLCTVMISVTTLDNGLKARLEPRAVAPLERLRIIETLASRGIPVGVMVAPVIPGINDREIESILKRASEAGASRANYVMLRLPREVRNLFHEWLYQHYPDRAAHVISLIRQARGGQDNQSDYGVRMRGSGVVADLIGQRFRRAARQYNLIGRGGLRLDTTQFIAVPDSHQLPLFDETDWSGSV